MAQYDYDLVTLGAGSGGVRASRLAAQAGARVAIIEESRVGGTCVIRGCIPKKLLVYASHFADDFEDAASYGWTLSEPSFDWSRLIAAKNREIDRLNGLYIGILERNRVEIVAGRGSLIDAHTIEVGHRRLTAAHVLIATGGRPSLPNIPGIEHVVTSNEALEMKTLPKRIVVVGGGYIAVEFAGIFNGLGAEVVEILRGDTLLRGFDHDIAKALADEMGKKGIRLLMKTTVTAITKRMGELQLKLSDGSEIAADMALFATGRTPNTAGIGLQEAGVKLDGVGAVAVDDYSRTEVPHIYAIGDVTNRMNLTPVAINEGVALVRTLFGGEPTKMDYTDVPTAVFSQPPLATVGLTEAEARRKVGAVDVYLSTFRPLKFTLTPRQERTTMKLIVDRTTDKVLGCHMLGMDAPEIVQGLAVALKCGATKAQFDATVGIHPSAAEEFVTMRDKRPDPDRKAAE